MIRVRADILLVSGALAGTPFADGYSLVCESQEGADSVADWINTAHTTGAVIASCTGTGDYRFTSNAKVDP